MTALQAGAVTAGSISVTEHNGGVNPPSYLVNRHENPIPECTPEREARFWAKVCKTDTCWLWTASLNPRGYGQLMILGKVYRAHRVAYVWANGEPPKGADLDHLCRVRECVNPAHLEAVSHRENLLRAPTSWVAIRSRQERCIHGHEFEPRVRKGKVIGRFCRTCLYAAKRRYEARKKREAALAAAVLERAA